MKLERGIPVAYLRSCDGKYLFVHVRAGPTVSSPGALWQKEIGAKEYRLCSVCQGDGSVEQVLMSCPSSQLIHCRVCRRKGQFMSASKIVTYRISDGNVVSKVAEEDLLPLRPHLQRAAIYSLIHGQTSDWVIRCIVMFGTHDGFSESWIVKVEVDTNVYILEAELPFAFW